jgi:hypothetical protein
MGSDAGGAWQEMDTLHSQWVDESEARMEVEEALEEVRLGLSS